MQAPKKSLKQKVNQAVRQRGHIKLFPFVKFKKKKQNLYN